MVSVCGLSRRYIPRYSHTQGGRLACTRQILLRKVSFLRVLHLSRSIVVVSPNMLISIPQSITRLSPPKTYPHSDKLIGLGLIILFIFSWSSFLNGDVLSLSISRIPAEPIRNSTLGVRKFSNVFFCLLTIL